jgi:hypothetical protein
VKEESQESKKNGAFEQYLAGKKNDRLDQS